MSILENRFPAPICHSNSQALPAARPAASLKTLSSIYYEGTEARGHRCLVGIGTAILIELAASVCAYCLWHAWQLVR